MKWGLNAKQNKIKLCFAWHWVPNQLLAYCQAHSIDPINVEGQAEGILIICARDEKKVIVEYREKQEE